jgi:predicted S18 family serine protease
LFGVGLENPCWCLDIYPILLSILIFLQPAYYADSCGYVDIPAVESQSGRGSTVRVTICVSPGSGYIRIYGVDRVESDTIVIIFAAYILAQIYSRQEIIYLRSLIYFGRNVEDISGPSAGALLTYAFYSILERNRIGPEISGTGAINIDGSVEAVGGYLRSSPP